MHVNLSTTVVNHVNCQVVINLLFYSQIAPIYLISCVKHGIGLLEILLYKQPAYHSQVLLKNIEICRMYDLDTVSSNAMKVILVSDLPFSYNL